MMDRCSLVYVLLINAVLCFGMACSAAAVELKAGTAKAVITPDIATQPIGVMGVPLVEVTHDIYARALVLNDGAHRLVIVTYDLNCLDVATPILRQRLRDELGIGPEYFIPLATHNHCAPIQIVPDNFAYGRWLAERSFSLIQEAIANEAGPVQVEFGFGAAYFLISLGNAPVDYEVQVLKVTRGGQPIAILFNHPTHPLHEADNKIDPGHPGYAVDEIERQLPGVMAMYADACGGNQFTVRMMKADGDTVQAFGRDLAKVALDVAGGPLRDVTGPITSRMKTVPLSLAKPMPEEAAKKLAANYPQDIGFVPYPEDHRETNWVRSLLRHYKENIPFPTKTTDMVCTDDAFLVEAYDTPREFPCRYEEAIVSRIGPLVVAAMQGEVCAPIGMRIKDAFRYETPIMAFGYMGEHNLYIPTREIVRLGLYQAQVIQIQYASPVGWAPTVEDEMVGAVKGMVREALRGE